MSIINNVSVLRVRIVCQLGAQTSYNVSHWKPDSTVPVNEFTTATLAGAIQTAFAAGYKGAIANNTTFRGVDCQDITITPPENPSVANSLAGPGTVIAESLPPGVCGVIAFKTGFAARIAQGRMFMPFPTETHSEPGGVPTAAYRSLLQGIGDIFVAGVTATGSLGSTLRFIACIRTRTTGQTFPLTQAIVRPGWGYQRRRGFFGAQNVPPF